MTKYTHWFFQNFVLRPVSWSLIHLFYTFEIRGVENLVKTSKPLVIVANHKKFFDGFLVGLSFPFCSRFFPFRFMTESLQFNGTFSEFMRKIGLMQIAYRMCGGFPSRRGLGAQKATLRPLKYLQSGQAIVMFPEGQLVREDELGFFYPGAAVLAMKAGANILPIHIFAKKRKILVRIGEPFFLLASDPEENTALIRAKIEELMPKIFAVAPDEIPARRELEKI